MLNLATPTTTAVAAEAVELSKLYGLAAEGGR
jgi:hypothetical protein